MLIPLTLSATFQLTNQLNGMQILFIYYSTIYTLQMTWFTVAEPARPEGDGPENASAFIESGGERVCQTARHTETNENNKHERNIVSGAKAREQGERYNRVQSQH
jgi:hypothetical protein